MARNTVTRNAGVIPGAANEGCGGMTVPAIQAGRKVTRILAGGCSAVTRVAA